MVLRRSLGYLLAITLLFSPNLAHAELFYPTPNQLFYTPEQASFFRLRDGVTTWQLSQGLEETDWKQTLTVGSVMLVVTQSPAGQTLWMSKNGLRFSAMSGLSGATSIKLTKSGNVVLVHAQLGDDTVLATIGEDADLKILPVINLTPGQIILQLFQLNGVTAVTVSEGSATISLRRLKDANWETDQTFPCTSLGVVETPQQLIICDQQSLYRLNEGVWQLYLPGSYSQILIGPEFIVLRNQSNSAEFTIITAEGEVLFLLSNVADIGSATVELYGKRLFVRSASLGLSEIDYLNGRLVPVGTLAAKVISTVNDGRLYLQMGTGYSQSDAIGSFSPIITAGNFTDVFRTASGYLLWLKNGSLTQYATANGLIYAQVPASWAGSSKIKEVSEFGGTTYLSLLNSSNRPNLYRSQLLDAWTRITLPTKVTYATDIAQARALPAGSLAELEGVVTVKPGVVAKDVIYLEDGTGGLQIFLSATKGSLPVTAHYRAIATGEISTSQTKRLIIGALSELRIGERHIYPFPARNVAEAVARPGTTAVVSAEVGGVGSGYLSLKSTFSSIKMHFSALSQTYQVGQIISLPVISDLNSSSGAVEFWATGDSDALVGAPVTDSLPDVTAPEVKGTVSNDDVDSTENGDPVAEAPAVTEVVVSTPVAALPPPEIITITRTIREVSAEPESPVAVAGVSYQAGNSFETLVLASLSLCVGMLLARGRRFRTALLGVK